MLINRPTISSEELAHSLNLGGRLGCSRLVRIEPWIVQCESAQGQPLYRRRSECRPGDLLLERLLCGLSGLLSLSLGMGLLLLLHRECLLPRLGRSLLRRAKPLRLSLNLSLLLHLR